MHHEKNTGRTPEVSSSREMEWGTYTAAICQRVLMATVFLNHRDRIAGWEECSHKQSTR